MNKNIYTLPDNSLSFDPISLRRKLLIGSGNKLNDWISIYNDGLDEIARLEAEESLVGLFRSSMGLKPLMEGGVGDETVIEYIHHYLEWLSARLNVSIENSQIDRPCLDCHRLG